MHLRLIPSIILLSCAATAAADGPFFATGIKIGEVDQHSAIIWARLTATPAPVAFDGPLPKITYVGENGQRSDDPVGGRHNSTPEVAYPDGVTVDTLAGAAPGAPGDVRVRFKTRSETAWKESVWTPVDPDRDFTAQIELSGLAPGTMYEIEVEARDGERISGTFRTAPAVDEPAKVTFTVSTGQEFHDRDDNRGFKIYDAMLKLDPDFFVHTGDIVYYDHEAKNVPLARWHWSRTYGLPTNHEFHRRVASYFIKDDHETWQNDCWPTMVSKYMGDFTFAQGQAIFLEQVPMREKTYRTVRWGKDLQVWLVEGRDFRSPNDMPDGPNKTIWGKEQMAWFKETVAASDATFRVLISPTPVIGPDRKNKNDNHANEGFRYEGDQLRAFIASQKNMVVVCGDRHWQYVSVDPKTGIREYSCGPASDAHAGGWEQGDTRTEHRYLNVIGGFLAATVERQDGRPALSFTHYDSDGKHLNTDTLRSE